MLSLVLCTLGREQEVVEYLRSLAIQTLRTWELIVIDQNEDGDVLRRALSVGGHRDVNVIRQPPGLSKARNAGWRAASSGWVMFPDDDSLYPGSDTLQRMWNILQTQCAGVGAVSFPIAFGVRNPVDSRGGSVRRLASVVGMKGGGIGGAGLAIRTDALVAAGGFDEDFGLGARFAGGEDLDLVLGLMSLGWKVMLADGPVIAHPKSTAAPGQNKRVAYTVARGALCRKYAGMHAVRWWMARDALRMVREGIVHRDCAWALRGPVALGHGYWLYHCYARSVR